MLQLQANVIWTRDFATNLCAAGQSSLGSLTGRAESTQGALVVRDVLLVFTFELLYKVVHHAVVKILATKMSVARRRLHLKDPVLDRQDRHIESAAAEVKDEDVAFCADFLVEPVRDSSGRRFIDDTENIETRDCSSVLCRLTLGVVEVRWNRHHRVCHRLLTAASK